LNDLKKITVPVAFFLKSFLDFHLVLRENYEETSSASFEGCRVPFATRMPAKKFFKTNARDSTKKPPFYGGFSMPK
jgi:hypothetical protein